MTHGDEKTIAAYDGDYRIEVIIRPFTDHFCPSLRGKPRIFLVQACRGMELDPGVVVEPKKVKNARYKLKRQDQTDNANRTFYDQRNLFRTCHYALPPIEMDFVIVRSTMQGYVSFRNTETGSWFIQELCNELETNSHEDFMTLVTHVNWAVSERESVPHKYKQILCTSTKLTKLLYFR